MPSALPICTTDIGPHERLRFFPTIARRIDGGWELPIRGILFEPSQADYSRKVLVRLLARMLKASPEDMQSPIFRSRLNAFMDRGRGGRTIAVQIGDQVRRLNRPTSRSGYFLGRVRLSDEQVEQQSQQGNVNARWLSFQAAMRDDDRQFTGRVQLLPPQGISVISDIDDTIKHTNVGERQKMLANTFLNEFAAVEGMAQLFQHWEAAGAAFHFASSSPWQLFEPLAALLDAVQFPEGSWHLRRLKFRDPSVMKLFVARRLGKKWAIRSILRQFPQRQFVLIGDSGEKDPEIYGALSRKYRQQVKRIFIRAVSERPLTVMRASKAFRRLPPEQIRVFTDPGELADLLPVQEQSAVDA